MNKLFFIIPLVVISLNSIAQEADSLATGEAKSDRNVMLNAESASAPRSINIGLPDDGAFIYIDGLTHGMSFPSAQHHWAGGNMFIQTGMTGLMEAVILYGEIGVITDTKTRTGGDNFEGIVTVGSSTNGLVRFDGCVSGPVKPGSGWYYSLGAYVNNDPTNVNAPNRPFIDQKQIYNFALSRRWKNTTLDASYRFSTCSDNSSGGYSLAPFIYNGDGTITPLDGFTLGRDCYFPEDDAVSYMHLKDGKMRYGSLGNMDRRYIHDWTFRAIHKSHNGWDLDTRLHFMYMQPSQSTNITVNGIDNVTAANGFTRPDGTPYAGYLQNRYVSVDDQMEFDANLVFFATKRFNRHHKLTLGFEGVFSDLTSYSSTFNYAHTVEANPTRIYKGNQPTWGLNTSSQYFAAKRVSVPVFAMYDFNPCDRLLLRTGVRMRALYQKIWTAARFEGDGDKNTRVDGFNLADENLANIHIMNRPAFDYAVSEHIDLTLVDRLRFIAEGFYSMTAKSASYFKNETIPSEKSIGNALARGGFTYDNNWMDITALASYITSWNNAKLMTVTKQINGVSETIPWTAQYGIGTLGFTVDGNVHLGGFNMHLLATWQDPRYKNYKNEFVFSDGTRESIDYTGKNVTGISQWMLEIDPSYSWDKVKVWASARYYSRQYVSRTNLAYFAGHWETFAGVDWKVAKPLKLSVNFVNLLFQNGAKGSIDVADTITDASELNGLVMSGSYIRPFTVDFMLTYNF